jgi:hypothetical protein
MHIRDVLNSRMQVVLWDVVLCHWVSCPQRAEGSLETTTSAARRHIPQDHLNPLNYTAVKPQISYIKLYTKLLKFTTTDYVYCLATYRRF